MRYNYRFSNLKKWAARYGFALERVYPEEKHYPHRWRISEVSGKPLTHHPVNAMTVIELEGDWATINYGRDRFDQGGRNLIGLYSHLRPSRDMRQTGVWLSPTLEPDGKESVWLTLSLYSRTSRPVLKSKCTDPAHVAIMLQAYHGDMEPGIFADWLLDHGYTGESIR